MKTRHDLTRTHSRPLYRFRLRTTLGAAASFNVASVWGSVLQAKEVWCLLKGRSRSVVGRDANSDLTRKIRRHR